MSYGGRDGGEPRWPVTDPVITQYFHPAHQALDVVASAGAGRRWWRRSRGM